MVHIKWLIALVVAAALSSAITYYATEKYGNERTMGQLSEMSIMRNTTYVTLVKAIDDGKYDEVRTKLRKMFDMETKDMQRAKKVMEEGCFTTANREYIDKLNRYFAPPPVAADKAK